MNNARKSDDDNDENKLYQYATLRPLQQKNETKQYTNKSNNFFRNSFNELNLIDTYSTLIDDVLSDSSISSTPSSTSTSTSSSQSTSTSLDETQRLTSREPLSNANELSPSNQHHTSPNDSVPEKIVDQCLYELDAYLEAIENSTSLDQSIITESPTVDDDTVKLINLSGTASSSSTSTHRHGFSTFPKNKTRHDRDRISTFDESPQKTSPSPSLAPTYAEQSLSSSMHAASDVQSVLGSTTFSRVHPQRNTIVTCTRSSMGDTIEEGLDIGSEQQLRKSRLKKTGLFIVDSKYFLFVHNY